MVVDNSLITQLYCDVTYGLLLLTRQASVILCRSLSYDAMFIKQTTARWRYKENVLGVKRCSHCARHRTTSSGVVESSAVVRCRAQCEHCFSRATFRRPELQALRIARDLLHMDESLSWKISIQQITSDRILRNSLENSILLFRINDGRRITVKLPALYFNIPLLKDGGNILRSRGHCRDNVAKRS